MLANTRVDSAEKSVTSLHAIFHLAKADFLERVRRYSFLITLLLTVLWAYLFIPPLSATFYLSLNLGGYRGLYTSAWIGGVVALLLNEFLPIVGFVLVKNTVERDYRTGVGQIIASSPVSNVAYIVGKWISNFSVLSLITSVVFLSALGMQLLHGEDTTIHLWALLAPFIFLVLPVMMVVAAMAVLFETIPFLSGGLGNIIYIFVYAFSLGFIDLSGTQIIWPNMAAACVNAFPDCYTERTIELKSTPLAGLPTFRWEGMSWTLDVIAPRFLELAITAGLLLVATLIFHRFDRAYTATSAWTKKLQARFSNQVSTLLPAGASTDAEGTDYRWKDLPPATPKFRFSQIVLAEVRLMLKGRPFWWYIGAVALLIVTFVSGSGGGYLWILLAWLWPLFIWSSLGQREMYFRTHELVFTAAYPIKRQLAAGWIIGWGLTLIMGSGIFYHLAMAGDWSRILGLFIGSLFIPTLALSCGVWTSSSKLFEILYLVWWYLGPTSGYAGLDFMSVTPEALSNNIYVYYLILTLILAGLTIVGRNRQIQI